MKKTLASLAVFFFVCSNATGFAQMPVGMSGLAPVVSPVFEKVGVVAAVQGSVKLKIPGQAGRIASSGLPVFIGEEVSTDAKGHLQILLLDETIFTIGPNSSIIIDRFVYNPKNHEGEIRASILAGVFRYVSGKIAAKKSDKVSVKLPNATIGFRGTIVGGQVNPGGGALVALLGPGDNNDANARIGSFTVEGEGGDTQDVNRPGFGVEVGANGGLSGVFQLSNDQVNNLTSGLMPSSGSSDQNGGNDSQGSGGQTGGTSGSQPGGASDSQPGSSSPTGGTADQGGSLLGGGDMSTLSGETGALTVETSSLTGALTNFTAGLDTASNQAAQDAAANEKSSITTYEQLARVTSGTGHYDFSGDFTNLSGNVVGTMGGRFVIDFGNQLAVIAGTDVWVTQGSHTVTTFDNTYAPLSFSSISNSGTFSLPGAWGFDESMNYVGDFDISIALRNQNGITAQQATAIVNYVKMSGDVDSGTSSATGLIDSTEVFVAPNGPTSVSDLTRITTGVSHYDVTGTYKNLAGQDVGTITGRCVIDFGNQTIGSGNSFLSITSNSTTVSTIAASGIDNDPRRFSDVSNGVVQWSAGDAQDSHGNIVGDFTVISLALSNANGVTAQQAAVSVTYTDGDGGRYSGISNGTGTGTGTLQSGA